MMTKQTSETKETLRRLKPIVGTAADELWLRMHLAEDREEQTHASQILFTLNTSLLEPDLESRPLLLPPPLAPEGAFTLGTIQYPYTSPRGFGLNAGEVLQHTAVFGRSGAGKTNLIVTFLRSLAEHGVPFLVFDWKQNYRDLLGEPWARNVIVLTAGKDAAPFTFNPLVPPPGTSPRQWMGKLSDVFRHAYYTGFGVDKFFREAVDYCYEKTGAYEGKVERWPTFRDVLAYLNGHPQRHGRKALWMDSIESRLESLTFPEVMGSVTCSQHNTDLRMLFQRGVVLELDALKEADKTFLISALLLWLHHAGLRHAEREVLRHVIVIEEAHHLLLKKRPGQAGEESVIDQVLREIRELGHGVVIVDQHPSLLSQTALGNTYTTITLNLKHASDIESVRQAMLLTREEATGIGRLGVGEAVVKLQDRIKNSFTINIPHASLQKGTITDADVRRRFEADVAQREQKSPPTIESELIRPPGTLNKERQALESERIDERAITLLRDVADYPWDGVADRYRRISYRPSLGTKLKATLITKGLCREERIRIGTALLVLLEPTSAGGALLNRESPPARRESLEHGYWKERLARHFTDQGAKSEKEKRLNGERVDLHVILPNGRHVGVEIETCKSPDTRQIISNIEKCRNHGYAKMIIFTTSLGCATTIQSLIANAQLGIETEVWTPDRVSHVR